MPARSVGALLFAAIAVGGCGKTIEEGDLESEISGNLRTQLKGQKITVDCPEGEEAKKGNAFSCRARIGVRDAIVDVRLQDDAGKFSFRVRSGKQ